MFVKVNQVKIQIVVSLFPLMCKFLRLTSYH